VTFSTRYCSAHSRAVAAFRPLVVTGSDLFDDGFRNQDCGSQALDQVEPTDAGEQDAERTRRRSAAGIRLSAFLAGPARSSSHFIAEFVEGHEIAAADRGSASADRAQFRSRRNFLRTST
jgi:hypothetical protein